MTNEIKKRGKYCLFLNHYPTTKNQSSTVTYYRNPFPPLPQLKFYAPEAFLLSLINTEFRALISFYISPCDPTGESAMYYVPLLK